MDELKQRLIDTRSEVQQSVIDIKRLISDEIIFYFIYLIAKTMLYSIKFRQNINMHGLLETAGYLNTSYADPWWTEKSTLLQDTIGPHIKITINRKIDAANCTHKIILMRILNICRAAP